MLFIISSANWSRAMQIISEMEDTPREPYGGGVGYSGFLVGRAPPREPARQ